MESKSADHWAYDQLIAHLYGLGPEDRHIDVCLECQARLSSMQGARQSWISDEVSPDILAAQRRSIYARLTNSSSSSAATQWRRWASAGAVSLLLGAGVLWYQEYQTQQIYNNSLSDAQLAQDVSRMAQNPEAQPTAPLQALFEE